MRTESRGLHDRLDYPHADPDWYKTIHLRLVGGELKQWLVPVEFSYYQPEPESPGEPWRKAIPVKEYQRWKAAPIYKQIR